MEILIGVFMITLGAFFISPLAGKMFRGIRDETYSRASWLARLPGARTLYGDEMQKQTRWVVGIVFVVGGVLVLLGIVDVR